MGLAIETGANWMLHNATSDEVILEGVELAKRRNLKITNHRAAGTPWLSIKEFRDATGGGDVDYLAARRADGQLGPHPRLAWLTEGETRTSPARCERDHEPGQQRLQLRRHRAGEVDVPRGRERRPRQRRRLRELLDGHGRADEVRRSSRT